MSRPTLTSCRPLPVRAVSLRRVVAGVNPLGLAGGQSPFTSLGSSIASSTTSHRHRRLRGFGSRQARNFPAAVPASLASAARSSAPAWAQPATIALRVLAVTDTSTSSSPVLQAVRA
ncbi:hypothetical protein ABZ770_38870 [Streptomyces sp. NPDC006654]|uniref:hypothetical protein n=1 Tax=Streptomyces sp. NPDC006654 TaxID=3156897 RepID=UPI0034011091